MKISAARLKKDRDFLCSPGKWPKYPVLPMKRRDGGFHRPEATGFVMSDVATGEPIVYFGNIWGLDGIAEAIKQETGRKTATWGEITAKLPHRLFADIDAILAIYTVD